MKLTSRFSTICVMGYNGSVSKHQDPRAAGGVKLCQARQAKDGTIFGKYINSNGKFQEVGEPFVMQQSEIDHWFKMGALNK